MRRYHIVFALLVAIIAATLSACFPVPEACFGVDRSEAGILEPVHFSNCSMDADHFLWEFGDGHFSTDQNPIHAWGDTGTFPVRLIAKSDASNNESVQEMTIRVGYPNRHFPGRYAVSLNEAEGHFLEIFPGNSPFSVSLMLDGSFFCSGLATDSLLSVEYQAYSAVQWAFLEGLGSISGQNLEVVLSIHQPGNLEESLTIKGRRVP